MSKHGKKTHKLAPWGVYKEPPHPPKDADAMERAIKNGLKIKK